MRNRLQTPSRSEQGFTLLEVMIAIAILAISMSMLFGSQSQSISLITESKFNTQASLLAGLKIAYLESGKEELINGDGDFGEDYPGYSWKIEIDDPHIDGSELLQEISEEMQQVDLTITWGEEQYVYVVRYFLRGD